MVERIPFSHPPPKVGLLGYYVKVVPLGYFVMLLEGKLCDDRFKWGEDVRTYTYKSVQSVF